MHERLTFEKAISPDLVIDQTRHAHSPRVVQSWPAESKCARRHRPPIVREGAQGRSPMRAPGAGWDTQRDYTART